MSERTAKLSILKINSYFHYIWYEAQSGSRTWASAILLLMPELSDWKDQIVIEEDIAKHKFFEFKDAFQNILTETIEGKLTWENAGYHIYEKLDRIEADIARLHLDANKRGPDATTRALSPGH